MIQYWRSERILQTIMVVCVASLTSLVSCARTTFIAPPPAELLPPPIRITAQQLYTEYILDEVTADASYKGKGVWFEEAIPDYYFFSQSENYIMIDSVKVVLQNPSEIQLCESGYIFQIVGECQGKVEGVVSVKPSRIDILLDRTGRKPASDIRQKFYGAVP